MAGRALTDGEWEALLARLPGAGVYAVTTTGILCRAGCPARTPLRRNVLRFETVAAGLAAGYRPCKRCRPEAGA
jgi:AraC family transcriptional regulator of adaptative response/methylated-DNA-[protein]-cysteine methyltransferase